MTINKEINNPAVEESLKRQAELEAYALKNCSFIHLSGSKLYGTNNEYSDTDLRGVYLHDVNKAFSILKEDDISEVTFSGTDDKVLFELKNFALMLREQKSNAIEALWVPDQCIIQDSNLFNDLRSNKTELISTLALDKMLGFANSQLKMAKRYEQKHFDKEMKEPLRKDFIKLISNPQNKDFGKIQFPIANVCAFKHPEHPNVYSLYSSEYIENKEHSWITPDNNFLFIRDNILKDKPILAIVEFQSEAFKHANLAYKNFLAWKENGNMEKLEISFNLGYQPKPMMHALRNLYMAKEFIETGELILFRKENEFLKDVRNGKFSLKECEEFYKILDEYIQHNKPQFHLPDFNDKLLNDIVRDNYLQHFGFMATKENYLVKSQSKQRLPN